MIIDNRICFGYGDIATGVSFSSLTLTYFKPPQEIGSKVSINAEVLAPTINIHLSYDECNELLVQLDLITKENCTIEIKDYILDFSNFNQGSVDVVKKKVTALRSNLSFCYAC